MRMTVGVGDDAATLLLVTGDLDDASSPSFVGGVVDATARRTAGRVVVDLSRVTFCNGAGVLAIVAIEQLLAPRPLLLRAPARQSPGC